ncbi:MAG: hypothetical protein ACKV19_25125 [Verrucomicrobiales bacterium]
MIAEEIGLERAIDAAHPGIHADAPLVSPRRRAAKHTCRGILEARGRRRPRAQGDHGEAESGQARRGVTGRRQPRCVSDHQRPQFPAVQAPACRRPLPCAQGAALADQPK